MFTKADFSFISLASFIALIIIYEKNIYKNNFIAHINNDGASILKSEIKNE